jgi:hypothetical protein
MTCGVVAVCAASAGQHKSSAVLLAMLQFFLGEDQMEADDSDDERDSAPEKQAVAGPSKEDVYKAFNKVRSPARVLGGSRQRCSPLSKLSDCSQRGCAAGDAGNKTT